MEKILSQFEALAKEIAANDKLQLLSFYLAPPAPASDVTRYQEQIGVSFPPDLLEYYSLCNGIQLRWIRKDNPAYSVEEFGQYHAGRVPFSDIADDSGRIEGSVYILPISETFGNREKYYQDDSLHANKQIILNGTQMGYSQFESKIFPFDVFHDKLNCGILVGEQLDFVYGSGTGHFLSLCSNLSEYLSVVIQNKGFVFARERNYKYSIKGEYLTRTVDTNKRVANTAAIPFEDMKVE